MNQYECDACHTTVYTTCDIPFCLSCQIKQCSVCCDLLQGKCFQCLDEVTGYDTPPIDTSDEEEVPEEPSLSGEKQGLPNQYNNCYVNVIMQILFRSPDLQTMIHTKYSNSLVLAHCLRADYCTKNHISMIEQCDAVAFLRFLLEQIEVGSGESFLQSWRSYLQCQTCNHHCYTASQTEPLLVLYPPSEPGIYDLGDLFGQQTQEQVTRFCPECQTVQAAMKYSILQTHPAHLFIHCFGFTEGQRVKFQPTLTTNYTDQDGISVSSEYVCKGIMQHRGTFSYGHYSIYMLDEDGWTHYNDEIISPEPDIENLLVWPESENTTFPLLWYTKLESDTKVVSDTKLESDTKVVSDVNIEKAKEGGRGNQWFPL